METERVLVENPTRARSVTKVHDRIFVLQRGVQKLSSKERLLR